MPKVSIKSEKVTPFEKIFNVKIRKKMIVKRY